MLGRGGVLGNVESDVVASAFGYFHRNQIARIWIPVKERFEPREAARNYNVLCQSWARLTCGE